MPPSLIGFDHIHVFVQDRTAAEAWYRTVLGMTRKPELESWAVDGGPLTLQDSTDQVHIALFERPRQINRATVALRVSGSAYHEWRAHLQTVAGLDLSEEDHDLSVSLYFSDPDGNPYEITTYDCEVARSERAG